MNNSLKKIGILALLTFAFINCSPPEQAPKIETKLEVTPKYPAPCEMIKYIDFETATNWYGNLMLGSASGNTHTFRIKFWQLRTGQTALDAVTTNAPIYVKDINNSNLTTNASGFLEILIDPIDTHIVDAEYTSTIIYIIEAYRGTIKDCEKANSYRYSRSNKQRG